MSGLPHDILDTPHSLSLHSLDRKYVDSVSEKELRFQKIKQDANNKY